MYWACTKPGTPILADRIWQGTRLTPDTVQTFTTRGHVMRLIVTEAQLRLGKDVDQRISSAFMRLGDEGRAKAEDALTDEERLARTAFVELRRALSREAQAAPIVKVVPPRPAETRAPRGIVLQFPGRRAA